MAISTQNANLVRQKTFMINRNPGVFYALKAFFLHLAANKGNPDLQLVNVDGTSMASDGGAADQVIANAACTLYAVYLKKVGSTAVWFKVGDSATVAAGDGTDVLTHKLTTLAQEDLLLYPTGMAFANGISIEEDTTSTGTTRTLAANRADGFIILGA